MLSVELVVSHPGDTHHGPHMGAKLEVVSPSSRRTGLLLLAVLTTSCAATPTSTSSSSLLRTTAPSGASAQATAPSRVPTTLPPESGYRGIENFCAVAPLTGTIHYDGTSGSLTGVLTVRISGLPANDEVNVNWSNDHVRVPVIGEFKTDAKGTSIQSSVIVSRLGEVRGVEVVLAAANIPNPVLGRLEPC